MTERRSEAVSKGEDRMTQEDVETSLQGFASLVDVEEELSPELHRKLASIARDVSTTEKVGWESIVSIACVAFVGINVLGAAFLSWAFLITSLLCAGAYAIGTRRLLDAT